MTKVEDKTTEALDLAGPDGGRPIRQEMGRALPLGRALVGIAAAGTVAIVVWLVVQDSGSAESTGPPEPATATAEVVRRDLVATTVTWLPHEGAALQRGDVLSRVNGRPTVLVTGGMPAWRTLEKGVTDGRDVRQLEQSLVAMGYRTKSIKVDRHFGTATERALKKWQRDLAVDDTGVVELGTVVFLPGQRRVASLEVALGEAGSRDRRSRRRPRRARK